MKVNDFLPGADAVEAIKYSMCVIQIMHLFFVIILTQIYVGFICDGRDLYASYIVESLRQWDHSVIGG